MEEYIWNITIWRRLVMINPVGVIASWQLFRVVISSWIEPIDDHVTVEMVVFLEGRYLYSDFEMHYPITLKFLPAMMVLATSKILIYMIFHTFTVSLTCSMNAFTILSFLSLSGMCTQPLGSSNSTSSTSTRSWKWAPALIDILQTRGSMRRQLMTAVSQLGRFVSTM